MLGMATSTGRGSFQYGALSEEHRQPAPRVIFLPDTLDASPTAVSYERAVAVWGTSSGPTESTGARTGQSTAEAIMELRRRSGLTWELLSDLFNVSRRTIHHWANGKPPSMDNEVSIRRALDAVRHLDEGSQRATRNRLLATVAGQSPFDMLADGRYGEILQMAQGAGASLTFGIRRAALSEDEQARRRPPPPHLLLESIEDRPEIPAEAARIFTPVRAD